MCLSDKPQARQEVPHGSPRTPRQVHPSSLLGPLSKSAIQRLEGAKQGFVRREGKGRMTWEVCSVQEKPSVPIDQPWAADPDAGHSSQGLGGRNRRRKSGSEKAISSRVFFPSQNVLSASLLFESPPRCPRSAQKFFHSSSFGLPDTCERPAPSTIIHPSSTIDHRYDGMRVQNHRFIHAGRHRQTQSARAKPCRRRSADRHSLSSRLNPLPRNRISTEKKTWEAEKKILTRSLGHQLERVCKESCLCYLLLQSYK